MADIRNSWTELSLPTLAANIDAVRSALDSTTDLIFVVKANAYGNGMLPVAACAWEQGVRRFAVVHINEALPLREALPEAEIVLLGILDPADLSTAVQADLVAMLVDRRQGENLAAIAQHDGLTLRCHAKIDTGMGRIGFACQEAAENICELAGMDGLNVEGLCSHFASSGNHDIDFADQQFARFKRVVETCKASGLKTFNHVCNSGGIQRMEDWGMDGVRCGILLYGYGQDSHPKAKNVATRPCLQWRTRVVQVKQVAAGFSVSYDSTYTTQGETCLATINVGYSDGYSRLLSNKGFVLIHGRRCPIVGRVTMNLVVVDVGLNSGIKDGDVVTLLGEDGGESIWADEMAAWRDTISYEILTNINTEDRRVISG